MGALSCVFVFSVNKTTKMESRRLTGSQACSNDSTQKLLAHVLV